MRPDVLLLDEPTNALDPRSQVWLLEVLSEWKAAGKTVVLTTHDLGSAAEFADRMVVLSEQHCARAWARARARLSAAAAQRTRATQLTEWGTIFGDRATNRRPTMSTPRPTLALILVFAVAALTGCGGSQQAANPSTPPVSSNAPIGGTEGAAM